MLFWAVVACGSNVNAIKGSKSVTRVLRLVVTAAPPSLRILEQNLAGNPN